MQSKLEKEFYNQLLLCKIKTPFKQYKFQDKRKWKCDFCWPHEKLIVEVEGGVYTNGRHTRGAGFTKDCEKYNEAELLGYHVLRITGEQVRNGMGIQWVRRYFDELSNDKK